MFGTKAHTDEDEAAGAILLGALIGGGSALATTYSEAKRKQELAKQEMDLWDKFKNFSNAAKNLAVENNKSFLKVFGSRQETGKDSNGADVTVDVPVYTNPATGKTEVDPQKLATIMARSNTNSIHMQESMSAATFGDNVWKEYSDRDALFSYVHTLARAGAVGRQDFIDLIKNDPVINGQTAKDLGVENLIRDNETLAMQYYDAMQDVKKTYARPDDLNSKEDAGFANTYFRVLSYLKWKALTLNDLKGQITNQGNKEKFDVEISNTESQIEEFVSQRGKIKDLYKREVFSPITIANEINALEKEIESGERKRPDGTVESIDIEASKQQLELKKLELEEKAEIYGTASLDYGSDLISEFIGDDFQSSTFPSHLSKDLNSEPKSLSTNLFYEMGRTKLNEEKVKDAKNHGDLDSLISAISGLNVYTDEVAGIVSDAAAELTSQLNDLKAKVDRLNEVLDNAPDEIGDYSPIELSDGSIFDVDAFGELYQEAMEDPDAEQAYYQQRQILEDERTELRQKVDELTQKSTFLNTSIEQQKTPSAQYEKLRAATGNPKTLAEELIKYSFAKKSQRITNFVLEGENALENNLTYFKDRLAALSLNEVRLLKKFYGPRTDISARTKAQIMSTLEDLERRLEKVLEYALKNKQTRAEIQENTMRTQGAVLETVLDIEGINGAIETGDANYEAENPISQLVYDIMSLPENIQKFKEVYKLVQDMRAENNPALYKVYSSLIQYVATKISRTDKDKLFSDIDVYTLRAARDTFPGEGWLSETAERAHGTQYLVNKFYNVSTSIH
jgi:hypothetical protein